MCTLLHQWMYSVSSVLYYMQHIWKINILDGGTRQVQIEWWRVWWNFMWSISRYPIVSREDPSYCCIPCPHTYVFTDRLCMILCTPKRVACNLFEQRLTKGPIICRSLWQNYDFQVLLTCCCLWQQNRYCRYIVNEKNTEKHRFDRNRLFFYYIQCFCQ